MIEKISFDAFFDRPIEDVEFISTGGYTVEYGLNSLRIDFMDYSANKDGNVLHVEHETPDLDYCPFMDVVTPVMLKDSFVKNVTIFVEADEPLTAEVKDVTFVCDSELITLPAKETSMI